LYNQAKSKPKGGMKMANDTEKMLNDYMAALNAHDLEKVLAFFADDAVYDCIPMGKVSHGKKEIKDFFSNTFTSFPDFKLEMKSGFNAGDRGAAEWVMSGTFAHSSIPEMPATGKKFSVRGAAITEFKGDKISRNTNYWNLAAFLQQVGLMPAPPQ
jgi:steroid delta-isomerase-like uncharacterized protein